MKLTYPDYNNSIMNVTQSILKHYGIKNEYDSIKELDIALNKDYRHIFLVLLDGFGLNLLTKLPKNSELRSNLRKEITSVFPPTTVAATNAVLSGQPPYANSYLGWVQYFKNEDSNTVVFRNEDFYLPNMVLKENLRDKYLSYEDIYQKIKKSASDVETYELFPDFRVDGFSSFDKQVERALEISKQKQKTFTYIYWTDPDATAHQYGVDSIETASILKNLNASYEKLISQINNDSIVILIADHGIVDVEEISFMEKTELLDCLVRKPSLEPRACNFFVLENKKDKFVTLFNKEFGDKFILLSKEELYQERLLGAGSKHPLLDDFLGDYIAIAVDKYMLGLTNEKGFKAHHAGLTRYEMMVPLIIFEKK